jgi:hypothetical protein
MPANIDLQRERTISSAIFLVKTGKTEQLDTTVTIFKCNPYTSGRNTPASRLNETMRKNNLSSFLEI